jgi:hypothetical protein
MARQVYDDILSDLLFDALGALAAIPFAYWAHTTAESQAASVESQRRQLALGQRPL